MDIRDDKEKFEHFMTSMSVLFDMLWRQAGGGTKIEGLRDPSCKEPLIGLVRDLRYQPKTNPH